MARNDFIFREKKINPQNTFNRVKEICKIGISSNGDKVSILSKKRISNDMVGCNYQFIICSDASFSSKDGNCAFGCAIFFKGLIVFAWSSRGGICSSSNFALNKLESFS